MRPPAGARDRRSEYLAHIQVFFKEFLADHLDEADHDAILAEAETEIGRAFSHFSLDGLSIKNMNERQAHFREAVDIVLRDLLLQSLSALDGEQMAEGTLPQSWGSVAPIR